jgi:threonine synthase
MTQPCQQGGTNSFIGRRGLKRQQILLEVRKVFCHLKAFFLAFHKFLQFDRDFYRFSNNAVICVPSGNFGNITAGLFGKKMGLPVKRFIAANNRNDIFYQYLQTGKYNSRPSKEDGQQIRRRRFFSQLHG